MTVGYNGPSGNEGRAQFEYQRAEAARHAADRQRQIRAASDEWNKPDVSAEVESRLAKQEAERRQKMQSQVDAEHAARLAKQKAARLAAQPALDEIAARRKAALDAAQECGKAAAEAFVLAMKERDKALALCAAIERTEYETNSLLSDCGEHRDGVKGGMMWAQDVDWQVCRALKQALGNNGMFDLQRLIEGTRVV
jgi:hypothetical protein